MRSRIPKAVWTGAIGVGMAMALGHAGGVSAQQTPVVAAAVSATTATAAVIGPETGLPLPRYVSLKGARTFARRGPSDAHRIDWVYTRRDLPLRITGEFDRWRRVEDSEGQGGWVSYHLLSGVRTLLVSVDMTPMRARPLPEAPELAYLEAGVVARIMECAPDWCRVSVEGLRGWIERRAAWGLEPGEVLD